jgi:hypothetical protein
MLSEGTLFADGAARWAALRRDPLLVSAVAAAGALHAELLHTRGRCGEWCYDDLLRMVGRGYSTLARFTFSLFSKPNASRLAGDHL